jgi:hypothetical protein
MRFNHQAAETSTDRRQSVRRGFSMFDLLVAFTLLVTAMSISTPLVVQHAQLLKSQRNYRLALDELTNQLERLTTLAPAELPTAIEAIAPSAFISERLPSTQLSGKLAEVAGGTRISLDIAWDEMGHRRKPVTLAAWVFDGSPRTIATTGASQP